MKTIWKYELQIIDRQILKIPFEAEILTVQVQYDTPVLWALVETDNQLDEKIIEIIGTGNLIYQPEIGRVYIATFQLHKGGFIGHVFEIAKP